MMRNVIVYTCAYNAEKTIERAIQSVLTQSYTHLVYHILDNGSTDGTMAIIRKMAADKRIIVHRNALNHVWEPGNDCVAIASLYDDADYFTWLDADDEIRPTFIEKTLAFAEMNDLDISVCGNDFVDVRTKLQRGKRISGHDLVIENDAFSQCFTQYHQYMRTYWAKLFSVSVLRRIDIAQFPALPYGWDTLFTQEAFQNAKRVGILAESLYKYYVSQESVSHHWDARRIAADRKLYEVARNYLIKKTGHVSIHNEEFLLLVYMSAIRDTLKVLWNAQIPDSEKIAGVLDVFSYEYTKKLAAHEYLGVLLSNDSVCQRERRELFNAAATWLLTCENVPDERVEEFCNVGEIACAVAENAGGWIFFKKLHAQFLIEQNCTDKARAEIQELMQLLPEDDELAGMWAALA